MQAPLGKLSPAPFSGCQELCFGALVWETLFVPVLHTSVLSFGGIQGDPPPLIKTGNPQQYPNKFQTPRSETHGPKVCTPGAFHGRGDSVQVAAICTILLRAGKPHLVSTATRQILR